MNWKMLLAICGRQHGRMHQLHQAFRAKKHKEIGTFRAFVCICAVPFHLYNLPCWRDYLWLQHKGSMGCASSLSGFLSGCQRSCKNRHCNNGLKANAFTAKSRSNVFIPFSVSYQQWLLVTLVQIQMISTSNQMILSSFTPPWHFQSGSTAVMEEPTICCASEPFSFLLLPCPASCHGNFLISPCHHVK